MLPRRRGGRAALTRLAARPVFGYAELMLRKWTVTILLATAVASACMWAGKRVYPKRWVYLSRGLARDADVDAIERIVKTGAQHGLNGILLKAGFDRLGIQPPEYFKGLERLKAICRENGVEIVPMVFGFGYAGSLLGHDRNLAAGLPVRGALFVAGDREARFTAGRAPVKLAAPGAVPVTPYRSYRIRCRVRAGGNARETVNIRATAPDGRDLARFQTALAPSAEWQSLTAGFNSWYADRVTLQVEAGRERELAVEGVEVEEVGLVNVLRRPGTPVRVRDEKTGTAYEEGRDFEPIADPGLSFRYDHDGPPIRLTAGSRIRPGARLLVDYFHGHRIFSDQIVACPSEPAMVEIWRKEVALIQKHLAPKTWFLGADEIRILGHCEACKRRNMGAAEILGDAINRQFQFIRAANPKADVWVWSDMFDPNHNARANYYLVDGDFTGSWKHLPKEIGIACWYYSRRQASLSHFSGLGLRTLAAAYYDADDLKNPEGWLEALDATEGAEGIMYTSWRNKFALLGDFGDLVSKRQ